MDLKISDEEFRNNNFSIAKEHRTIANYAIKHTLEWAICHLGNGLCDPKQNCNCCREARASIEWFEQALKEVAEDAYKVDYDSRSSNY